MGRLPVSAGADHVTFSAWQDLAATLRAVGGPGAASVNGIK